MALVVVVGASASPPGFYAYVIKYSARLVVGKHSPMSGLYMYSSCCVMEFLGLRPQNTIIPHSGYNTHTP